MKRAVAIAFLFLSVAVYGAVSIRLGGRTVLQGNIQLGIRTVTTEPEFTVLQIRGHQIATRSSDGMHAVVVAGTNTSTTTTLMRLRTWTTSNDVSYLEIPGWWFPSEFGETVVQFIGDDRIVIANAINSGSGPIRVIEYTLSEVGLTIEMEFEYGTTRERMDSDSCPTSNGGMMFVTHWQDSVGSHTNAIQADAVYRPPPIPFLDTTNTYERVHFHDTAGFASYWPTRVAMTQATNGVVHVFWGSDSYGKFGLARFTITNGLELVDIDGLFLSNADGVAEPSGEHPRLAASVDGERVLLAYQNAPHSFPTECEELGGGPGTVITSPVVISSIYPDKSKGVVTLLDWPSLHISFPYTPTWPRTNGVYFYAEVFYTNNCTLPWRNGLYDYVEEDYTYTQMGAGYGKLMAYAPDGWLAFLDASGIPAFFQVSLQ